MYKICNGGVTSPRGFFAGAVYAGIKKKEKKSNDLAVLFSQAPCTAAAVFTANKIKAAPVLLDQQIIEQGNSVRAIVVNSGCANACTGETGMANARATAQFTAASLGISADEVLVSSTGVIGEQFPIDKVKEGINRIVLTREGGHDLTRAIMTTDTRPKEIALKVKSGECQYIIGGTAKGAGMIHPNMATMLCFITTDARVEREFLRASLKKAIDNSFNMVTVDGDTSTNDTVAVLANGLAGNKPILANSPVSKNRTAAADFQEALEEICLYLAKQIVADGEGATRTIEVLVNGALNVEDARMAARTIAGSPLVKTAVHGCDPNWGRILAAAGRSGAQVDQNKSDVYIADKCLLKSGVPQAFDKKRTAALMNCNELVLRVDLNLGNASARAWGCDLSREYVTINAEYTT